VSAPVRAPASRGIASWALLAVVAGLFGYVTGLPNASGLIVAVAGVLIGGFLRRSPTPPPIRALAPVPAVLGLTAVAAVSPLGLLPELLAGASGIAILAWLADDPGRPAGGLGRAQLTVGIPAVALGIAWTSALLLPSNSASLGVAVGLLVFVVAAIAFLIGQPTTFDREATSA
jgi:hypothetical protein